LAAGQGLPGNGPAGVPRVDAGRPAASLSVGDTFSLGGKTWTVTATTDRLVGAKDEAGARRLIPIGSATWKQIVNAGATATKPASGSAAAAPLTPAPTQRQASPQEGLRQEALGASRHPELIALRKRESILKSIRACLG
jgi:hypothetical protein